MTLLGLLTMTAGAVALSLIPESLGVLGYVAPLALVTAGYAVFQTADNTAVMAEVGPDRRGVVSGMLGLSRNLGLFTGASVMGAVFTHASASADIASAPPGAVATGMRFTFLVASALILVALAAVAAVGRAAPRSDT